MTNELRNATCWGEFSSSVGPWLSEQPSVVYLHILRVKS